MINNLITLKFQQSMEETGIKPPDLVVIDGQYHRFPTNGKTGDTAGWYVLNDLGTIVAGVFGCWRSGVTSKWSSINEETLDKQQLHRVHVEIKKAKKLADQKKMELQQKASINAEQAWSKAKDADSNHPYLVRKGVKAYGIKQFHFDGCQCLMIPLMDTEGKLWSYQRIYPDNRVQDKIFLKNGRVTGLFHTIGEPTPTRIIAEGYATAASLHESTGHCVHVAFNCHNSIPVAKAIREKYSDADVIIAADDDHMTSGNPGLSKAKEAAIEIGVGLVVPDFGENRGSNETDFNDLHRLKGPYAVRVGIELNRLNPQDLVKQTDLAVLATLAGN